jgi:hypothetical protein
MRNETAAVLPAAVEHALSQIERQCESLATALARGEPLALEQAATGLRQMAIGFSDLLQQHEQAAGFTPALRTRVKALAAALAALRENLLRRAAVVERALDVVLPGREQPTYAAAPARAALRTYSA